jgi:hypothetical protein
VLNWSSRSITYNQTKAEGYPSLGFFVAALARAGYCPSYFPRYR